MGLLRFYNSADDELLFLHWKSLDPYTVEELKSGDRLTIEYQLLQRDPGGGYARPWSRVLAADYSLYVGLFLTSTRAQLAYQNAFTNKDEVTKQGTLALDATAVMDAVNGAPFEAACTLEIKIAESGGQPRTVYREPVTLKKWLIDLSAPAVVPTELAATQAWVRALFMAKDGTHAETPIDHFFMQSRPSKLPVIVWADDDGELHSARY